MLMVMRDVKTTDSQRMAQTLLKIIDIFSGLKEDSSALEYFETALRYIWQAGNQLTVTDLETVEKQLATTYPEGSEVMMSLAEIFQEKGREQGIAEGKVEGFIEVAKKALKEGVDIALIAKLTGLSKREIEKLAEEMESREITQEPQTH